MRKPTRLELLYDFVGTRDVDFTSSDMVSSTNDFVPANFNEGNGLSVSGFETNRGASRNIKTVSIGFDAIEVELRIGFDEMIM